MLRFRFWSLRKHKAVEPEAAPVDPNQFITDFTTKLDDLTFNEAFYGDMELANALNSAYKIYLLEELRSGRQVSLKHGGIHKVMRKRIQNHCFENGVEFGDYDGPLPYFIFRTFLIDDNNEIDNYPQR